NGKAAAVEFYPRLDQGQAKAGAPMLAGQATIQLTERFKCDWNLLGRHSDAGIGNLDQQGTVGAALGADADPAALGCELDRVPQQIDQHLLEHVLVRSQ